MKVTFYRGPYHKSFNRMRYQKSSKKIRLKGNWINISFPNCSKSDVSHLL